MRRLPIVAFALASVLAIMTPASAVSHTYYTGATAVVRSGFVTPPFTTIVDEGGTVCQPSANRGAGGVCIPWNTNIDDTIKVTDSNVSPNDKIAFQVCIDNNGDNLCTTGQQPPGTCRDYVVFSHGDGETWFNPIGPLPRAFATGIGCSTAGFKGWVVMICLGAHQPQGGIAHPHAASTGSVSTSLTGGIPGQRFGNFCGGDIERFPPISKPYRVI